MPAIFVPFSIEEVVSLANSGEFITHAKAKMLIATHNKPDDNALLGKFNSKLETPKPSATKPVKLNFTLAPSDRDRVQETLNLVKQQRGFLTDAEALMYIINCFWQSG